MKKVRLRVSVILFSVVSGLSVSGDAQTINTIAGTATAGYNGNGPAVSAQLYYPGAVSLDASGNLYIADMMNAIVRKIDLAGNISTVAGVAQTAPGFFAGAGGAATSATFSWYMMGVVPDGSGNLYIADAGSNVICKVNGAGTISIFAGFSGVAGSSGDNGPATSATLNYPVAMAFDATYSTMYIADCYNHKIRKIVMSTGTISTAAGTGAQGSTGDNGLATGAKLNYPAGVAVDAAGNVYIGDGGNNKIRKITLSTGNISTYAGTGSAGSTGDGGTATSAKLNGPQGVALDASGNLYIADQMNNRVRKVTASTGNISLLAGTTVGFSGDGGAPAAAQLNQPWALAVDASCNVYISDNANSRVRLITGLACTLPLELISFTGRSMRDGNHLEWITGSEKQNDYFMIEKSINGIEYYSIGKVKSSGNTPFKHEYKFLDEQIETAAVYYRLAQTDFIGSVTYSDVIQIDTFYDDKELLSISPNPSCSFLNIELESKGKENLMIKVTDAYGNVVMEESMKSSRGKNIQRMGISDLSRGVYFVELTGESTHAVQKFIKE